MEALAYDYVVIGGGPAGLQMAYFLEKAGRSYVVLEQGESVGTFFRKYPRHRKLISANKIYTGYSDPIRNMRWDWNSLITEDGSILFKEYSKEYFPPADAIVDYLGDFADKFKLNVKCNARVARVSRPEKFLVTLESGEQIKTNKVIVASGVSKENIPDVPGIDLAEQYGDMPVDPESYADQRVLILGKGNSAFETADSMIGTASRIYVCSPTPITLSWKSKFVGHLRAINNNFIDTYQLKLQNVMLDAHVLRIEKSGDALKVAFHYVHADDEIEEMEFDRVLVCTGFKFDSSIYAPECRPELAVNGRFPKQTSAFESENVPDMYFAGTLMQQRDYRKKQSGFIHGFRHNIESLSRVLEERYHDVAWPSRVVGRSPEELAYAILQRVNQSPGMWQQTGFIGDVIEYDKRDKAYRYYEEVVTAFAHDDRFKYSDEYYVVTLEFGLEIIYASPDPLAVDRIHKDDVENANLSTGIHPIIRKYCRGELVAEHHVLEDIIPEWDEESVHLKPLIQFFGARDTSAFDAGLSPMAGGTEHGSMTTSRGAGMS